MGTSFSKIARPLYQVGLQWYSEMVFFKRAVFAFHHAAMLVSFSKVSVNMLKLKKSLRWTDNNLHSNFSQYTKSSEVYILL